MASEATFSRFLCLLAAGAAIVVVAMPLAGTPTTQQAATTPSEKQVIIPDPQMQAQIRAFAAISARDKVGRYREAVALQMLAGRDLYDSKLILNMAYYAAHEPPHPLWLGERTTFH